MKIMKVAGNQWMEMTYDEAGLYSAEANNDKYEEKRLALEIRS